MAWLVFSVLDTNNSVINRNQKRLV